MITANDIASYIRCPEIVKRDKQHLFIEPLTNFEDCLRRAFIEGERKALLKDTAVSPRMLTRAWDNIWWPEATANNLKPSAANAKTLNATKKFVDYCKYDISDYLYPTVGVDIESQVNLGSDIFIAHADIVKVNLESTKNTVILNMDRKNISLSTAGLDPAIRATAYGFYSGDGETIIHISMILNEKKENVEMVTSVFRPEDMEEIERMLRYVATGIKKKVYFFNPYCGDCNICFKS